MAQYAVRLRKDDPFAATFRTFHGINLQVNVSPQTVELTEEEAKALKVAGVSVEPVRSAATGEPHGGKD